MAKPLVIRSEEGAAVPFLRGILTKSLQDAGLSFEDAYQVASAVREGLKDEGEVESVDLRRRVAAELEPYGKDIVRRYRTRRATPPRILLRYADGHAEPFSRGRQRLALSPCGLSGDEVVAVVDKLVERLAEQGAEEISSRDLGLLTHELLDREIGEEAARRYRVWEAFSHSDRPLIVLVGGATASGKSTLTTQLSHRLEILRSQSTDMLREVMRMMTPQRLLPVLHVSSFLAWTASPAKDQHEADADVLLADGYLHQVELLSVACEAVVKRAIQERVSLVLEGVHVHPHLLDRIPRGDDAIVVPVMLAVLRPKELRRRIQGRGKRIPGRRAKRYLEHFDTIWRLQSFLLSEADRAGIPIVANEEIEDAVTEVIGIILTELSRHFTDKASKVFR